MSEQKKKIENRDDAKKLLVSALDDAELDLVAMANEALERSNCICGAKSGVDVTNRQDFSVRVKVTKTCGVGDDDWFTIQAGKTERWSRCVYRKITISLNSPRDSINHSVAVLTNGNAFEVNGGRLRQIYTS